MKEFVTSGPTDMYLVLDGGGTEKIESLSDYIHAPGRVLSLIDFNSNNVLRSGLVLEIISTDRVLHTFVANHL